MGKTKQAAKGKEAASSSEYLVNAIVQGIKEKKGHEIVVMDLNTAGSSIADFFVICHGDSSTQVDAIAHSVENEVFKITGEWPVFKEGFANAEWILLDFINVVVHIFNREQREFYGIERFWADAETRRIA
jgi:ribosome-associated protein